MEMSPGGNCIGPVMMGSMTMTREGGGLGGATLRRKGRVGLLREVFVKIRCVCVVQVSRRNAAKKNREVSHTRAQATTHAPSRRITSAVHTSRQTQRHLCEHLAM